jgi:hypothetical protein
MEENKVIEFKIMVMYVEILEKAIIQHNNNNNTDFRIKEVIDDDVIFCVLQVTKYKTEDIFNLGHRLAVIEYNMRAKGEIDW